MAGLAFWAALIANGHLVQLDAALRLLARERGEAALPLVTALVERGAGGAGGRPAARSSA